MKNRKSTGWKRFLKTIWIPLRNRAIFLAVCFQVLNALVIVLRMIDVINLEEQAAIILLGTGLHYWVGLKPLMKQVKEYVDKIDKPVIPTER